MDYILIHCFRARVLWESFILCGDLWVPFILICNTFWHSFKRRKAQRAIGALRCKAHLKRRLL